MTYQRKTDRPYNRVAPRAPLNRGPTSCRQLRICPTCRQPLSETSQSYCKPYYAAYFREWRKRHPNYYFDRYHNGGYAEREKLRRATKKDGHQANQVLSTRDDHRRDAPLLHRVDP